MPLGRRIGGVLIAIALFLCVTSAWEALAITGGIGWDACLAEAQEGAEAHANQITVYSGAAGVCAGRGTVSAGLLVALALIGAFWFFWRRPYRDLDA